MTDTELIKIEAKIVHSGDSVKMQKVLTYQGEKLNHDELVLASEAIRIKRENPALTIGITTLRPGGNRNGNA